MRKDAAMGRILVLALLGALAFTACGGEADPAKTPAGAAQVRFFEDLYAGRFARVYATLHPAHQKLVSRDLFVRCARETTALHKLESVEVLDVSDDDARIPDVEDPTRKLVRGRITSTEDETDNFENHEVKVDDRWRWVLSAKAIDAYGLGRCPRL
jgi:hypothetical protein